MGMNNADILAICIKDEIERFCQSERYLLRMCDWVDQLAELADPQAETLRTYQKALRKVIEDSKVGVVSKSHLDYIEKILES